MNLINVPLLNAAVDRALQATPSNVWPLSLAAVLNGSFYRRQLCPHTVHQANSHK